MTYKRFTLIECNGNIEDGCTQNVYDGGEDVFELLDLLNSLNDENEQLKRQIGNLEHTRDFCADVCADCERLEKENDQLKMGINSLKLLVQNWEALDEEKDGQLDKQNQALKKLKKENEQLKSELLDIEEDRDYYKSKASSLEEGYLQLQDREIRLEKEKKQLRKENNELKDKNSQLQETLAFRSNQLALMERLVDDLGSEEMERQMEEILND